MAEGTSESVAEGTFGAEPDIVVVSNPSTEANVQPIPPP